jgi:hypothetical protein
LTYVLFETIRDMIIEDNTIDEDLWVYFRV